MDEFKEYLKNNRHKLDNKCLDSESRLQIQKQIHSVLAPSNKPLVRTSMYLRIVACLLVCISLGIIFFKTSYRQPLPSIITQSTANNEANVVSIPKQNGIKYKPITATLTKKNRIKKINLVEEPKVSIDSNDIDKKITEALNSPVWEHNQELYAILKNEYGSIQNNSEDIEELISPHDAGIDRIALYRVINQQKLFLLGQINEQSLKIKIYSNL